MIKEANLPKRKPGRKVARRRKRRTTKKSTKQQNRSRNKLKYLGKCVCDHCGLTGSKSRIRAHIGAHRSRKVVCTCDYCGRTGTKYNITKHVVSHVNLTTRTWTRTSLDFDGTNRGKRPSSFICFTCHVNFPSQSKLLKHAKTHG